MSKTSAFNFDTLSLHAGQAPDSQYGARAAPIYLTTSFVFKDADQAAALFNMERAGHVYSRISNPTNAVLEERIAALEGGRHCILVPSGLAAIANVGMALLKAGDEVLLPDNVYGPNRALADGEFAAWGITHQLYDPLKPQDLEARIGPKTRLVWLEAPGSVTMEFPDLPALVRICRARGVTCALDNTWGAGLAFRAFDLVPGETLGADISVHALTKYPSGGGDVLMGSIVTRDEKLHQRIKLTHMRLGWGVGGNDAEAVLRSLPSMALRYRAHDEAARTLARWLAARDEVVQVLHPALPGSPGHAHWQALCGADGLAAGLFSIVFDERFTTPQVDAFCDALQLFKLGYSWGGPVSLVVPYDIPAMRSAQLGTWKHKGVLVRFSVGLEDVADLQADLARALEALHRPG